MNDVLEAQLGFAPGFADRLVAQWNRGPVALRDVVRIPLFTEPEFMRAILGTARDFIADPSALIPPGRVYLGGELVKAERLPSLLPRGASESVAAYAARIRQSHPGQALGIVLDNSDKHLPPMRDRLVPVLHHLFSQVGYPARRNHLCVYAGNYRSTPFGIHRDDCHVVMFCGIGRKTMAFWPRPYFDQRKDLFVNGKLRAHLPDHIADATVLEIGPHDALYWSADDWHVAVSETDDFHGALSVGIYFQGSSPELMTQLDVIAEVTRIEGLDIPDLPAAPQGTISAEMLRTSHLKPFFDRWERLRAMTSRIGEDDYRALGLALRLVSSAGYGKLRSTAPVAPETLAGRTVSCAVPESLVVGHARGGLMVGANGSSFHYADAPPAIESIMLALRDGTPRRFDDLAGTVDESARVLLTTVVRDLIQAGAVAVS